MNSSFIPSIPLIAAACSTVPKAGNQRAKGISKVTQTSTVMQYALARTIRWLVLMATSLAVGGPAAATPASSLKAGVDAYAQGLYARSAGFAENLLGGAKVLSIAQRHEALCLLGQSRTRLGQIGRAHV